MIKSTTFTILTVAILFLATSCNSDPNIDVANNLELEDMFNADQKSRMEDTDEPWEPKDMIRRHRVMQMLANGEIKTGADKFRAAMILQHTALTFCNDQLNSISPENYYLAYTLSKSAFDEGFKDAANLAAANYDRYSLYTNGYQKFGTQKIYDESLDDFVWAPIDSTTTDDERALYHVPPLAELLKEADIKTNN